MTPPPPPKPDSIADFLGWLGRQVGHITKAVQTDVTRPSAPPRAATPTPTAPTPAPPEVLYRDHRIEEQPHPQRPDVLLRRTVVDEIIVQPAPPPGSTNRPGKPNA